MCVIIINMTRATGDLDSGDLDFGDLDFICLVYSLFLGIFTTESTTKIITIITTTTITTIKL